MRVETWEKGHFVAREQKRSRSDAAYAASDQGLHCLQKIKPFSFRNFKSDSLIYLKSKLESSSILCEGVHSI